MGFAVSLNICLRACTKHLLEVVNVLLQVEKFRKRLFAFSETDATASEQQSGAYQHMLIGSRAAFACSGHNRARHQCQSKQE